VRNQNQNTTNFKNSTNAEKLVLVRNSVLYGLNFEKIKQEKTTYDSGINSIPTFLFLNNNTECFIDFSNKTNKDLESKLKNFFAKVPVGTTLYIFNATYYDSNKEVRADLSGQYVFTEYFNGILKVNVTTVNDLDANTTRYDKKFFEDIPLVTANVLSTTSTEDVTIIRNLFGSNTKNSFNYIGAVVGDFLSFSDIPGKYEIIEITSDPNGIETVKVKGTITPQQLTDKKILVSLYIRINESYTIEPDVNETDTGACVQSINGVIVSCIDNHTISQCRFRANAEKNISATIGIDSFCFTPETDTAVEISTTDKLVEITSLLATNIAIANSSVSSVVGPINRNGNSKTAFYGRS
jgi:hypothetical protein